MSRRSDIIAQISNIAESVSRRILIVGEPGMGKSTLVAEAMTNLRASGFRVLHANPSYAERGIAYSTLWDMLSSVDWESNAALSDEYRLFLRVALGASEPQSTLPPLAVSVAVEALFASLAAEQPVVLVIDDAQWVDPESQLVLQRAWRRSNKLPVYTLTTRRAPAAHDAPNGELADADSIVLPGLSLGELDEVARSVKQTQLTAAQLVALHSHTAGNPMWALELIDRGAVSDLGALPVGSISAPTTLTESVEHRLAELSSDAADVVAVVALIGRSSPEQLIAVLDLEDIPHDALAEAERAGFLTIATDSLRIAHPVHASAAVTRLDPARRRELHAAIARSEPGVEAHAHHLSRSERPGPNARVAAKLDLASTAAGKRGAPIRAAYFAAKAVARSVPGSIEEQHRLLAQAHQLVSAGDYHAAAAVIERIEPLRLDCARFDLYTAIANTALSITKGNAPTAAHFAYLARALPADAVRFAAVLDAFAESDDVSIAEHMRLARGAIALLDPVETPNAMRRAVGVLIRAEIDLGLGINDELVSDCTSNEKDTAVGALNETGLAQRAFFAKDLDDVAASRTALTQLIQRAHTMGEEGVASIFEVHAAATELLAGELALAAEHLERSGFLPSSRDLPPSALATIGTMMIAHSQWAALDELVALQSGAHTASAVARALYVHGLLGLAASAREDWPLAVTQLRLAAAVADDRGIIELGRRFRVDLPLIEALFHNGDLDEARERLDRVRGLLDTMDRPISRIALHRANSLDLAASGDILGAIDEATGSVDLARIAGRRCDEGLALVYRARLLKRLRRTREARLDLERARELATASQNGALLASIDGTEATMRRVRSATTLTPAEERVLELVRSGGTNREISAQLFISVRTVESHVAAIVRKTGAGSRLKLLVR